MMDPEKYFAEWDTADTTTARTQPRVRRYATPLDRTPRPGYTRRLLSSGCVLICLKARTTPVGFISRSK